VWWCHIDKKWPFSRHETHMKNNYTQYTSYMDEHMKACMLEVYMAMIFPKNQIPLIVPWMVYVKVVLGVPNNKVDNVPPYWLDKFVLANPLTPPKIHPPFTSIPLVFTRRHHVLPWSTLVIPPFLFSIGTANTNYSQNNKYFLYSRSRSCFEWPNCPTPLGTNPLNHCWAWTTPWM
jgi:hypothetical protein